MGEKGKNLIVHTFKYYIHLQREINSDTTRIRAGSFCYILLLFYLKSHLSHNRMNPRRAYGGFSPTSYFRSFVSFFFDSRDVPSLMFSCSTIISSLLRIIETVQIRGSLLFSLTLLVSFRDFHFNWVWLNQEGKKPKIFTRQFDCWSRCRIS